MKLFTLGLVTGLVLAIGFSGRAGEWVTSTIRSYHMERGKGYEEANIGAGVETDLYRHTIRMALGFYRNSERRDSLYGAAVWCPMSLRFGNWLGCGLAGGVSGYNDTVAPLAGLVLSYEGKEWGSNILVLPNKKGDLTQGLVALQIKRRF